MLIELKYNGQIAINLCHASNERDGKKWFYHFQIFWNSPKGYKITRDSFHSILVDVDKRKHECYLEDADRYLTDDEIEILIIKFGY